MSAMTTPMQRANAWSQLVIGAAIEVHRIKGLVHRLISGRHTAVGDLADFQSASAEHT